MKCFLILCFGFVSMIANAEQNSIQDASFLVGTWVGQGSMMISGNKYPFSETEVLTFSSDGTKLVVVGDGQANGKTIHHVNSIMSFDSTKSAFQFQTTSDQGSPISTWTTISDNTWVWGFHDSTSGAKFLFTITINGQGQWFEIGEKSTDGTIWTKFFEMTLTKQ